MADPSTVALVSVIVAGTTALATPLSNAWYDSRKEARRFEREMFTRDVAELRTLLDGAASAFDEAFAARAELTRRWMLEPLENCSELIDEVQEKRNRLVVLKGADRDASWAPTRRYTCV
jgi:hypothetical protein